MQNKSHFDSIREYDPYALNLVLEDRIAYYLSKRIMDFAISFILLMLLSPLMILIAILILVFSPGPVFFIQNRVGVARNMHAGRFYWKRVTFSCYKFRTMKIDADPSVHQAYIKSLIENDEEQMVFLQGVYAHHRKLVNDSRITRLGRFLRKLSLDELPQLLNVLLGDMSLVGPRPAIPYEVEMYKPFHLRRFEAQPGISGLQQVTARCTVDFDQQVRLDIEYIEKQSLLLDMKIMLKTCWAVISTTGAY